MPEQDTDRIMKNIAIIGNCQAQEIAYCLQLMLPDYNISAGYSGHIRTGRIDVGELLRRNEIVVTQSVMASQIAADLTRLEIVRPALVIPTIFFSGFHPDFVYARQESGFIQSPLGNCNSAIALHAWRAGYNVEQTLGLFNKKVFKALGYDKYFGSALKFLVKNSETYGLKIDTEIQSVMQTGVFLHTPNHPKIAMVAALCRALLERLQIVPDLRFPERVIPDRLQTKVVWPLYPDISEEIGVEGEYIFKMPPKGKDRSERAICYTLPQFIEKSFEVYESIDRDTLRCERFDDPRYVEVLRRGKSATSLQRESAIDHPYRNLPDYRFWKKSVAAIKPDELDPVVNAKFVIDRKTKIATAGSCFAQHIARALKMSGFRYHVVEDGAEIGEKERHDRNFGVYSARYGNIYTTAQMHQLVRRAERSFKPQDNAWARSDGRWVDPFRPQIEPDGFGTVEELEKSRDAHFSAVTRLWRELDVLVFTFGLTEAWRSKVDGAVFPLAPGVAGGNMDTEKYEFHNYSVEETIASFEAFLSDLRKINPLARVIITVSPVPLAATYVDEHVLQATTYSKAVLRVAATQVAAGRDWVEYFPSFEIITGSYSRGVYFEDDLRTVTAAGVNHVMRTFMKHSAVAETAVEDDSLAGGFLSYEISHAQQVVCDEELLDAE
jgi:hypothetical protein